MKRGADGGDGWGSARKHGKGSNAGVPKTRHVFKVLVPDALAANLLGSRGAIKDEIQNETNTKLVFSNRGDYFPKSSFRVLGIYADEPSCIVGAFGWLLPKIIDLGEEERKNPPKDGPELLGKEPGEYIFRFCVTKRMSSTIIGAGGSNIKQIRADTGAKVFIDNESQMDHQLCRVIGPPEQILPCLERVNDFVQEDCEEQDFQDYASLLNFNAADSGSWATPPSEPPPWSAGGGGARSGSGGEGREGRGVLVPPPKKEDSGEEGGEVELGSVQEEVDSLADTLGAFPQGTAQLQYSVSCDLPAPQIASLLEQAGEYIKYVEDATSTSIDIESDEAEGLRMMTIVGQLLNVYTAHAMILMKLRVLEAKEIEEARRREVEQSEDPEVLKARIQELQEQLAKVTSQLQLQA